MTDKEKVAKAFEYLNWYFTQDDGAADKNAVKAWEVLIREQEPLKPFYCEADDSWGCGNCGETVGYSEFNPGGIDPVRNKYCPDCGRKVQWDDT